jgi:hypothetical protein
MTVGFGARIGARTSTLTARRFFETYQDRILFGTDGAAPKAEVPSAGFRGRALNPLRRPRTSTSIRPPGPTARTWRIYGIGPRTKF